MGAQFVQATAQRAKLRLDPRQANKHEPGNRDAVVIW